MLRYLSAAAMLVALAAPATAQDLLAIKPDTLDTDGIKFLRDAETILIPMVVLQVAEEGEVWVTAGGGMLSSANGTARAKGKFVVTGLDKAMLQDAARLVEEDFVTRLRAAGFTVATYADIKDHPETIAMKRYAAKADARYGLPTDKVVRTEYVLATATDEQNFDPPLQGYHWGFRKIAKEKNYTVVVPVYTLDAPQMWGESEEGYKRAKAGINIAPGMNVTSALTWILTPKGGGGILKLKSAVQNAAEEVGSLDSEDKSPTAANAVSKGLSFLGGSRDIQTKSTSFVLTADQAKFKGGLLRGGYSVNALIANAAKAAKGTK
jgi:hypothetical protein